MFQGDPSHSGVGTGNPVLTSHVLWKTENFANFWSSPAIVDGVVYVGASFVGDIGYNPITWADVYAFKASNGALIWDYQDNSSDNIGTPAVLNGVVYFSSNHYVGALDASNGHSLWNNTANGGTSPTVVNGILFDNNGHVVYALNATNGNQIWISDIPGLSPPAFSEGIIYTCSLDFNIYALNATNGNKVWNYTTGSFAETSPAISNGIVYFGSNDGNVYALNSTTGVKIWNYRTGGFDTSSPSVSKGVVYVGSGNDNVYALNAKTGSEIWSYYTGYPVASSPAVVDGVVYISSNSLDFYAFNCSTGYVIWRYPIGEFVSSFAAADGILCVGTQAGYIVAFGSPPTFNLPLLVTGISTVVIFVTALIILTLRRFKKRKREIDT